MGFTDEQKAMQVNRRLDPHNADASRIYLEVGAHMNGMNHVSFYLAGFNNRLPKRPEHEQMKKVDASQSISKMNTESAIRKKNDPRLRKMTQVSTKRNQVKKLVSARKYNSSMRKTDFINGTLNLFLCGHF